MGLANLILVKKCFSVNREFWAIENEKYPKNRLYNFNFIENSKKAGDFSLPD